MNALLHMIWHQGMAIYLWLAGCHPFFCLDHECTPLIPALASLNEPESKRKTHNFQLWLPQHSLLMKLRNKEYFTLCVYLLVQLNFKLKHFGLYLAVDKSVSLCFFVAVVLKYIKNSYFISVDDLVLLIIFNEMKIL